MDGWMNDGKDGWMDGWMNDGMGMREGLGRDEGQWKEQKKGMK